MQTRKPFRIFACLLSILGAFHYTHGAHAEPLAFLVSGGQRPGANHCDFAKDIEKANETLKDWSRVQFYADGPTTAKNAKDVNAVKCDKDGTDQFNLAGRPVYQRLMPASKTDFAAKFSEIEAALKQQVENLKPGDPVVLYFTDHGGKPAENRLSPSAIILWGENLSVEQLRQLVGMIPPQNKVILVNDHCFGGGMLAALKNSDGTRRAHSCGFSPAHSFEYSYQDQSFMHHARKLKNTATCPLTFSTVYDSYRVQPNLNSSPTSVSSDFLNDYFDQHAPNAETQSPQEHLACATKAQELTQLKDVRANMASGAETLLQQRIERLLSNLRENPAFKGDSKLATTNEIFARLEKQKASYLALDHQRVDLDNQIQPAKVAYAKSKLGKIFTAWREIQNRISPLKIELANERTVEGQNRITAKIQDQLSNLSELDLKVQAVVTSAKAKNKDFAQFYQSTAGKPGNPWPAEGLSGFKRIDDEADKLQKELAQTQLFATDLKSLHALELLKSRKDISGILQYLDMLECENTSLDNPASEGSQ